MKQRVVLSVAIFLAGCATTNPILGSNPHLQRVGQEQARRDTRECQALADQLVPPSPAERAAHEAAIGGGRPREPVGAVVPGGTTPIGQPGRDIAPTPAKPTPGSPAWKEFVGRCLKERGYEVTGWE